MLVAAFRVTVGLNCDSLRSINIISRRMAWTAGQSSINSLYCDADCVLHAVKAPKHGLDITDIIWMVAYEALKHVDFPH